MKVIFIFWNYEHNKWINNMKQIGGDEYTPDPQYWPKYVLDYYQRSFFETKMCEILYGWSKKHSDTDMFKSITYALNCFEVKLSIGNSIMMEVYVICSCCHRQADLVLTVNIEKRNDFSKIFCSLPFFSSGYSVNTMEWRLTTVYFK